MKPGDTIRYLKFGIPSKAKVSQVEAYFVVAHDGMSTIIFPKKIN